MIGNIFHFAAPSEFVEWQRYVGQRRFSAPLPWLPGIDI
jgi:hypothetical protein